MRELRGARELRNIGLGGGWCQRRPKLRQTDYTPTITRTFIGPASLQLHSNDVAIAQLTSAYQSRANGVREGAQLTYALALAVERE